jgi:hypothetical protein
VAKGTTGCDREVDLIRLVSRAILVLPSLLGVNIQLGSAYNRAASDESTSKTGVDGGVIGWEVAGVLTNGDAKDDKDPEGVVTKDFG